ncbi:tetratricopeptide repeat protein, partial [bacterium]|nr:tetratricopeptide repeat protein [bacterium]
MGIKIWWPVLFVGTIILACVLIFPSDLRLADLFDKAGRIEDALEHYHKVLATEPNRYDIRIQLGQLYVLNNEPEKALVEFEAAAEHTDLGPVQLDQLYQIYSSLENKEKTVAVLKRLVAFSPNDLHYRIKLADAYEWNRQGDKAIGLYDQLLKQDPDNLRYLNKLVSLNLSQKNYSACITRLNHIVRLEPENQDARLLLGNIYLENNQRKLASREFERCLRLLPDNEALRVKLAELYLWMENYENGVMHYEYLVRRHVLKDDYFDKLITHTKDFYPDKAIEYFNFRLKYLPRKKELREQLLDLSRYLGLTDDAIEQLKLLIQSYPEEISYQLELAQLYQETQQPALAADTQESIYKNGYLDSEILEELIPYYQTEKKYSELQELYAAAIGHGLTDYELRNEYAELLVSLRYHDEAIIQYSKLLELAPRDSEVRAALADLYVLREDNRRAYKIFWQGVDELDIRDEGYLFEAAQFFTERQHYSEAVTAYEKLMRQNPYNRYYNTLAADLYIQTKDFKKAGLTYQRMLDSEPDDLALKFQLASLHWLQNDRTKTELVINDIEASHTDHPNIDREIGKFYFEHGFLSNAVEHLEFAIAAAPTDSATMRMLGLSYAWSNQSIAAKKLLNRYHRRYSFDYYTHFQLGELYRGEGNNAKAQAEFEMAARLVQSAPQTRESFMVKGKLYAYRNQPEESRRQFEKLINTYPADQ